MSDPLEAAANYLNARRQGTGYYWDEYSIGEAVQAFMRVAIGCPECGGTGKVLAPPGNVYGPNAMCCPAECVEIEFLGETIFADPDKCEWRAYGDHARFRWQPKWSAIKGDET